MASSLSLPLHRALFRHLCVCLVTAEEEVPLLGPSNFQTRAVKDSAKAMPDQEVTGPLTQGGEGETG